MASYLYTNFVPTLLHALFVIQVSEFSHSNTLTNVSCIGAEREALLKFKQDLIDPLKTLSSWTDERCCNWEGVECNNETGHVSKLDLEYHVLGGKIRPVLSELKNLKYLDLSFNNFSGYLPNQFGNFKNLKFLDLSYNSISGPIPTTVDQLSVMRYLALSYNNLSGNIPKSIGQLPNLKVTDFGNNRLDGVSELHLANLANLTWFRLWSNEPVINVSASWIPPFQINSIFLSNCKVGPEFPKWLRAQRNNWQLLTSNVSISGEVPHWLPDVLSNISELDLLSNMLRGNILRIIGKETRRLWRVSLSRNNLSGDISNSLCMSPYLYFLDLSKNQLSGRLPQCWGKSLNCLVWIPLGHNMLTGQIPNSLCDLVPLGVLGLHKNRLNGVLSQCLLKLDLVTLDLGDNLFTGRIPPFSSPVLSVFDLGRNYFTREIPLQLCQLRSLQYLSLVHNNLSGVTPPCLSNFLLMWANSTFNTLLDYEGWRLPIMVNIRGTSLECTSTLRYLFSIDLSSNALKGQLPDGLTKLARLQNLNLSQNKLIGIIPSDIDNLRYLKSLDLSNNNISGKIPLSISNLDFLSYLDLSFNNLSGPVPLGYQLRAHLATYQIVKISVFLFPESV